MGRCLLQFQDVSDQVSDDPKRDFSNLISRTFGKKSPTANASRSFVQFILEPLYKILAHVSRSFPPSRSSSIRSRWSVMWIVLFPVFWMN